MTIERSKYGFTITCDECDDAVEFEYRDFHHALAAAKMSGWRVRPVTGGFEHDCPLCARSSPATLESTRKLLGDPLGRGKFGVRRSGFVPRGYRTVDHISTATDKALFAVFDGITGYLPISACIECDGVIWAAEWAIKNAHEYHARQKVSTR